MLSLNHADVPWQGCPEELHLEELHHIFDKIVLPFCGSGIQISPVCLMLGGLDLVLVSSVAPLDNQHGVGDSRKQFSCRFSWLHIQVGEPVDDQLVI